MSETYLLIVLCGVITYAVRSGGHVLMSYFGTVHHRVEAGLEAVPVAVLSALVAPAIVTGSWPDVVALVVVCLASMRFSLLPSMLVSLVVLVALRHLSGVGL